MSFLDPFRIFSGIKQVLNRTQGRITARLKALFGQKQSHVLSETFLLELENLLLEADFGHVVTGQLIAQLKNMPDVGMDTAIPMLKTAIRKLLLPAQPVHGLEKLLLPSGTPRVILVVGINGAGKTTQCAKLAYWFQHQNKKVLLAAGDTYRAAAVEQLGIWANRLRTGFVSQATGSDPASVLFDALQSAQAKKYDVLIADTAGRLQAREDLAQELKKMDRVLKKLDPHAPHEVILVLDGTLGQNSYSQVEWFQKILRVDSLLVTKLDGSAKGGVVVGLTERFQLPIRFLGSGEQAKDLAPFAVEPFVEALFESI